MFPPVTVRPGAWPLVATSLVASLARELGKVAADLRSQSGTMPFSTHVAGLCFLCLTTIHHHPLVRGPGGASRVSALRAAPGRVVGEVDGTFTCSHSP